MNTLKEIKNKNVNSFSFPPVTPINYIKNLHQTPVCKNRVKYKEQAKTDKTKKLVPVKSRKIITARTKENEKNMETK